MPHQTKLALAIAAISGGLFLGLSGSQPEQVAQNTGVTPEQKQPSNKSNNTKQTPSFNTDTMLSGIPSPEALFIPQAGESYTAETAEAFFEQQTKQHANGEHAFMKSAADLIIKIEDADSAKRLLNEAGRDHFGMNAGDDTQLINAKHDQLGNTFFKFQQTFNGLKVDGREIVVSSNSKDQLETVQGFFDNNIDIDTTPQLAGRDAVTSAIQNTNTPDSNGITIHTEPELQVFIADGNPVLAYKTIVEYSSTTDGTHLDTIFVDANTAQVLNTITNIHSSLDRQIYDMSNNCLKSGNELPGKLLFGESGSTSTDQHAQDAYKHTGIAYNFYNQFLNRDSLDGKGIRLRSAVHGTFDFGQGSCSGDNAVFLGAPHNQMVFGEGGSNLVNPAGALDITAHELTHGVTSTESNLKYQNESGAINEAMSDIFGAGAEAWSKSGGTANGNPSGGIKSNSDTWTIGEDSAQTRAYKRVMNNPTADGNSKDDYNKRGTCSSSSNCPDNGYVHTNSGIMNLAFALVSDGGKHPSGATSNTVPSIGIEKALKIYYHANTNQFTISTGFTSARTLLASSAETLFGECSAEWTAIQESYDAVNVPGNWTACTTDDNGGDTGGDTGGGDTTPTPTPEPTPTGDNLMLTASVISSRNYSSSYLPEKLKDGNSATFWASPGLWSSNTQDWIQSNFGTAKSFSEVSIDWLGTNYAGLVTVWIWNGSSWQSIAQETVTGDTTISFAETRAQYMLVTLNYGKFGRWFLINELEVR